jgi:ribosomal protein S18 acetylase RimI-like enzyme
VQDFVLRRLDAQDIPRLLNLMAMMRVQILGSHSQAFQRAVLRMALASPAALAVVALRRECDPPEIVGFAIAVTSDLSRMAAALMRHPLACTSWIIGRFVARLGSSRSVQGPGAISEASRDFIELPPPPRDAIGWDCRSPTTCRIAFIGVSSAFRGNRIAERLYSVVALVARDAGYSHILCRIASDNTASIRMHQRAHWRLFRDNDGCLGNLPLLGGETS